MKKTFPFSVARVTSVARTASLTRAALLCLFITPLLDGIALVGRGSLSLRLLQWIAFMAMGAANVWYFRRRLRLLHIELLLFSSLGWTVTLALAAEVFGLSCLVYGWLPGDRMILAWVSSTGFLLPFTIAGAWESLYALPEREYKTWFSPEKLDRYHLDQARRLPVKLKLRRNYFDVREEQFPLMAPVRLKIGRMFQNFILDAESKGMPAFETEDEARNPYGWQFYASDFGGVIRKFLDPQRTLEENGIRKNSIIVARRVRIKDIPNKQS